MAYDTVTMAIILIIIKAMLIVAGMVLFNRYMEAQSAKRSEALFLRTEKVLENYVQRRADLYKKIALMDSAALSYIDAIGVLGEIERKEQEDKENTNQYLDDEIFGKSSTYIDYGIKIGISSRDEPGPLGRYDM